MMNDEQAAERCQRRYDGNFRQQLMKLYCLVERVGPKGIGFRSQASAKRWMQTVLRPR